MTVFNEDVLLTCGYIPECRDWLSGTLYIFYHRRQSLKQVCEGHFISLVIRHLFVLVGEKKLATAANVRVKR